MPLVDTAGSTSRSSPALGRSIVSTILKTYPSPDNKWIPIILSCTSTLPKWASNLEPKPEIRIVDYASPSSLLAALKRSGLEDGVGNGQGTRDKPVSIEDDESDTPDSEAVAFSSRSTPALILPLS
ncbi:hypothetical protein BDZ45DRAFT_809238 [Acephala macrosclerotiorum]|nr:hypothetical protein BDZ45DRAFT_809238 [Acephala macrosclerotiorum]